MKTAVSSKTCSL